MKQILLNANFITHFIFFVLFACFSVHASIYGIKAKNKTEIKAWFLLTVAFAVSFIVEGIILLVLVNK